MSGPPLQGKTLFITGGSRGIGLAIALRAAQDGANVTIAAKTTEPHPKLPGTIYTAAAKIEAAGGQALPVACDVRDEAQVKAAVAATAERFGGIDICVNNASAISLTGTLATPMKRFDLMHQINVRGSYLVSQTCIPFLKGADNPYVLNLSPPLDFSAKWFQSHPAYSLAKYAMSLWVLGMAEEFRQDGIAFNALWPRTTIATAAVRNLLGGDELIDASRKPEIMGDAAYLIVTRDSHAFTGNFCIDDTLLAEHGVTDFKRYKVVPDAELRPDFFVPDQPPPPPGALD